MYFETATAAEKMHYALICLLIGDNFYFTFIYSCAHKHCTDVDTQS